MYYSNDGTELTKREIKTAIDESRAVITWSHGNWKNVASLAVYDDAEDAEIAADVDTRGDCYAMYEEVWCELADDYQQALKAASGTLIQQ